MNINKDYTILELGNGLKVLVYPQEHVNSVTIVAMVRAGHFAENIKNNGVAHLLEHMLFDGTERYPDYKALSGHFDRIAGEFGGSTSYEMLMIGGSFVDEELGNALDTLNQLLFHPLLTKESLVKEKSIIFDELRSYEDSNDYKNFIDATSSRFYEKSVLSLPIGGTSSSIQSLTHAQIIDFYKKHFRPDNIKIVIAGKIDLSKIKKMLNFTFDQKNPKNELQHKQYSEKIFSGKKIIITNEASQKAYIRMTFPSFSWKNDVKDRITLAYLCSLLAERKDSLLFSKLREENGWIYNIDASYTVGFDIGSLEITTSCPLGKSYDVINEILKAINQTKSEKFDSKLVERVKEIDRKRIKMAFDTSEGIVKWFAEELFYRYPDILLPEDFIRIYKTVTPEDIQKVANEIFDLAKINVCLLQELDLREEKIYKEKVDKLIDSYK